MAEAQLQQFLEKVRQLNAFVALSEAQPALRQALRECDQHHEVVALAKQFGFDIGRRWGDQGATASAESPTWSDQHNLFSSACPAPGEERLESLLAGQGWRLERIHSCLASSPDGFWYDQSEAEWVCLIQGQARLQFADEPSARQLQTGDHLWISPGRRHRVLATDPAPGTIWLALFWPGDPVG